MRDKPSFDEWEELHPPPKRRHEGLTDGEWAERWRRSERNFRIVFGVFFGFAVGVGSVWHWLVGRVTFAAALLVVAGCMLLFAALFARKRDADALEYAAWILLPEWKFFERLPAWAAACVLATAALLFVILVAAIAAVLVR